MLFCASGFDATISMVPGGGLLRGHGVSQRFESDPLGIAVVLGAFWTAVRKRPGSDARCILQG
ncbi:MAG: hypothetical protein CMJ89_16415 [Planctomycetes bacterium]|nr:hypothetical protein [Planctomycetota bacterium]